MEISQCESVLFCMFVRCGSLFQFIGEMEKDWERDVVEFCPKVYRCVDGLNIHLYLEAVAARDSALGCQNAIQDMSSW